jgi:hypothetical protein
MPSLEAPSHGQLVATLRERLAQPDGAVERDLVQGGEQLDDACLRRWLRADNWVLDKAEKRLREHAKWRVNIAPNGRIDENELDADKVYLQGRDKAGRPCIVVTASNHIVSQRKVDECKRCICYALDRACEQVDYSLNPDGQLCIIFDLRGLGISNLDVPITRSVFDTLANHYPERMGVLFMFDAPFIFWGLWKCVSPFIEAETLKKVQFVYASDPTQLRSNFDPEELPEEFGGKAKLVPLQKQAAAFLANGSTAAVTA